MLTVISIVATCSLIITEILLVFTMRAAVKELRLMRRETPRMFGASAGLTLLVAALAAYRSQGPGVAPTE